MAAVVRRDLFIGQWSPGTDGGPPFKVSNSHCERLGLAVAQRHEERARIVLRGPRSKLRKENEDAVQIEFTLPALRATLYKSLKRDVGRKFVKELKGRDTKPMACSAALMALSNGPSYMYD